MRRSSCVRRVTQTLNAEPEGHADAARIGGSRITVTIAPDQIRQALSAAAFPALVETAGVSAGRSYRSRA